MSPLTKMKNIACSEVPKQSIFLASIDTFIQNLDVVLFFKTLSFKGLKIAMHASGEKRREKYERKVFKTLVSIVSSIWYRPI
jgi:hypothetical protein